MALERDWMEFFQTFSLPLALLIAYRARQPLPNVAPLCVSLSIFLPPSLPPSLQLGRIFASMNELAGDGLYKIKSSSLVIKCPREDSKQTD
jgi:hypothetical protein